MNSWDEARSSCNAPQEGTAVHNLGAPYVLGAKDRDGEHSGGGGGDDDDSSLDDGCDDSSSERGGGGSDRGSAAVVQGISSRGRVVRSRWNSRRVRK